MDTLLGSQIMIDNHWLLYYKCVLALKQIWAIIVFLIHLIIDLLFYLIIKDTAIIALPVQLRTAQETMKDTWCNIIPITQ